MQKISFHTRKILVSMMALLVSVYSEAFLKTLAVDLSYNERHLYPMQYSEQLLNKGHAYDFEGLRQDYLSFRTVEFGPSHS